MWSLKTSSVGMGRKCSSPAQRFLFDTFCPPHFCQARKRRTGRDFFFVRRLPCLSTADFTDPCKLMPSPVCLIVSSVFCLGGCVPILCVLRPHRQRRPAAVQPRLQLWMVTPCDEASSGLVQRRGDRCRKCSGQSTSTLVGKPFDVAWSLVV